MIYRILLHSKSISENVEILKAKWCVLGAFDILHKQNDLFWVYLSISKINWYLNTKMVLLESIWVIKSASLSQKILRFYKQNGAFFCQLSDLQKSGAFWKHLRKFWDFKSKTVQLENIWAILGVALSQDIWNFTSEMVHACGIWVFMGKSGIPRASHEILRF